MAKQWQTSNEITITGGSDTNNEQLRSWLEANATQLVEANYISSVNIGNDNYQLKDSEARTTISTIEENQISVSVIGNILTITTGTIN